MYRATCPSTVETKNPRATVELSRLLSVSRSCLRLLAGVRRAGARVAVLWHSTAGSSLGDPDPLQTPPDLRQELRTSIAGRLTSQRGDFGLYRGQAGQTPSISVLRVLDWREGRSRYWLAGRFLPRASCCRSSGHILIWPLPPQCKMMLASKSRAFSNKRKGPWSDEDSSISDIWSLLSEDIASVLRRSVVSLVLTHAYGFHSIFSGIAIECQDNVTKFVTTGTLARAILTDRFKEEIKVHCEGNVVATGYLYEHDSSSQLALVKVLSALDVQCVRLNRGMECRPCKQLIVVGRRVGTLITASGEVSYESGDREFLIFSQISENWIGAAFFDINGEFVGMNHNVIMPSKLFLERSKSREVFHYVGINGWYEITGDPKDHKETFHPLAYDVFEKERFPDLCALGYPIPSRSMINRGMILVNTFECPFGDVYPKGIWGKFRKRVSSEISRNVVALASFKGDTRIFACSGVFIEFDEGPVILTSASLVRDPGDENKIIGDLRIKVLLPGKRIEIGTLKLHSLQYNVALVSVDNYRALCPVNLERLPVNLKLPENITNDMFHACLVNDTTVVAIGRIFQSGALMAASGKLTTDALRMLDCGPLDYSTCKTTKAGIGGPLVDIDGNFIGMNFHGMCYKEIGTPYMDREDLTAILKFLKTKETKKFYWGGTIVGDKKPMNKWPVPDTCWCDPSDLEEEDRMNDKGEVRSDGSPDVSLYLDVPAEACI